MLELVFLKKDVLNDCLQKTRLEKRDTLSLTSFKHYILKQGGKTHLEFPVPLKLMLCFLFYLYFYIPGMQFILVLITF